MLKVALTIFISLAFILPQTVSASIYGMLKGKVVDEDGNPATGATVAVEGTSKGAYVKSDGKFIITNIRSGKYNIKISFVGYETITRQVQISADQTTEIDIELKTGSEMLDEVVIEDRALVNKSQVGIQSGFDSDDIQRSARQSVNQIVSLSSGVTSSGSGFNIRGARSNDTQVMVDGMDVGNQFTGGYGAAGTEYYPMVSSYATEEIQVKKGGFGAEYGNAMGGIVNTVVKTGRDDSYDGFLAYRTDLPSLYGSQSESARFIKADGSYAVEEGGEGLKYQGKNEHNIEFGAGGPIPFINKTVLDRATFYISSRYQYEQYRNNSYEYYDPVVFDREGNEIYGGNNLGQLDNQSAWIKNITGRMNFGLSKNISFIVGGSFGLTNLENQTLGTYYMDDNAILDGEVINIPERVAKVNVTNNDVSNAFIKLNHTLDETSYYEIRISYSENNDVSARRVGNSAPSFFGGFDVHEPEDNYRLSQGDEALLVEGRDFQVDIYQPLSALRNSEDGALEDVFAVRNPLTGYYEGDPSSTEHNPFGFNFTKHGNFGFQFRMGNYLQLNGSFTKVISGEEFEHNLQAGFEFRKYELGFHSNSQPYANVFYDVYSSDFGGNIYTDPQSSEYQETSDEYRPIRGSVYLQDQISYKGIILTPGLRFEMFNSNASYRTQFSPFVPRDSTSLFAEADPKFMISPRINVSYPITDVSVFKMNFGIYYQMPELQYIYDGVNIQDLRSIQRIGNPNIDPQRTNQYQVAYSSQIGNDFAFDVSAYYNDIYNQMGYSFVVNEQPYWLATVGDYGTNKGIEIDLRKRTTDNIGFRLAYTLASVEGTSDNATYQVANFVRDPITRDPALPLSTYSLNRDVTHRANFTIDFNWGDEEGPSIGGIRLLENSNINFTSSFRSGLPYTLTELTGQGQLSERNALRGPSRWQIDARISKQFLLSDFFGDGMGNTAIEFYVDVFNVTNRTAATNVYSGTQSSLYSGILEVNQQGNFEAIPQYEEYDPSNPATYATNQYNQYGKRNYSISTDIDRNGVVTQEERYQRYVEAQETLNIQTKPLYQIPRRVHFGTIIRF